MIHFKNLQEYDFDDPDLWGELVTSVVRAIYITYHTTVQKTPADLVFSQDMQLNIKFLADQEATMLRKRKQIHTNTTRENSLRVDHDYEVGDKVLTIHKDIHRKLNSPTKGSYEIVRIYTNDTINVSKGVVTKKIRCKPYIH